MIAGVPKETFPGERRVAMVPADVARLAKLGLEVVIEAGAGSEAGFPDAEYAEKGATLATRDELFSRADLILQVRAAGANPDRHEADLSRLRKGQIVVAQADPLGSPQASQSLASSGATLFALELVPRITRAQAMDVLSSQASVAGYKAVLMAAGALPRMFPMLNTAAGTIKPAKVLVVGAGVAGLQAIASARRLGAVVFAYDIRAAVKEQIESLGAKFVDIDLGTADAEAKGGYAKELSEDALARQRQALADAVAASDVVITTAAVPGKKAPVLLDREMIARMAPGSLVLDLAAERGGNCALTQPGESISIAGVTIWGPVNVPSTVPYHASQMYARNVANFLGGLIKKGVLKIDLEDEVLRESLVVRDGEIFHPRVRELLGLPPLPAAPIAPAEGGNA